jgi:hypothetical protein
MQKPAHCLSARSEAARASRSAEISEESNNERSINLSALENTLRGFPFRRKGVLIVAALRTAVCFRG